MLCVIIVTVFVFLSASEATSETQNDCDIIYETMIEVRKKVVENQSLRRSYRHDIESAVNYTESLGISINDNIALRKLACEIADATTLAELAQAINMTEEDLNMGNVQENNFEDGIEYAEKKQKELTVVHQWQKKSGFPDIWPIRASFEETKEMLDDSFNTGRYIAFWRWDHTHEELAKFITDSTSNSLENYLENIGIKDLEENAGRIEAYMTYARLLAKNKGLRDYIKDP